MERRTTKRREGTRLPSKFQTTDTLQAERQGNKEEKRQMQQKIRRLALFVCFCSSFHFSFLNTALVLFRKLASSDTTCLGAQLPFIVAKEPRLKRGSNSNRRKRMLHSNGGGLGRTLSACAHAREIWDASRRSKLSAPPRSSYFKRGP